MTSFFVPAMRQPFVLSFVSDGGETPVLDAATKVKYIWVRLSVLREYLRRDLQMPNRPFKYDFERAIDDWVFMCFFVGNDFLPHLPSLEIRENAIDRLVRLYKDAVRQTGVRKNLSKIRAVK